MKFRYDKKSEKLIVSEAETIEYNQLRIWLKRHVEGWRFQPAVKRGLWDGKVDFFNEGKINQGLWKETLRGLYEIGHKFEIENKQDFPINRDVTLDDVKDFCKEHFKNHKIIDKDSGKTIDFFPYDYQIETAYKILKNRYCLAEVATSGGKSLIISIVFFYILREMDEDAKILLVVPSVSLVTQMTDSILEFYHGFQEYSDYIIEVELENGKVIELNPNEYVNTNNRGKIKAEELNENDDIKNVEIKKISKIKKDEVIRIEEIMSDKPRKHSGTKDPNIYISTYQSLAKISNWGKEFFQQFHTVAVDESHQCKSKSLGAILKETFGHATYRFGVSGTFPGEDSCEILTIQSLLGPKVTSIKAKKLMEEGRITPVQVKQIILNHDDPDFNDKLKMVRKNPKGGGGEAYRLEGEYIRNSEKRNDFITNVAKKCKGNTLMLFNIVDYGKMMYDKFIAEIDDPDTEIHLISGEVKKSKRQEIFDLMEKNDGKKRVLLATYGTLSTGISIKNLHNVVFLESFKSETRIIQSIGRGLRKFDDKSKANIFDLTDCFVEQFQNNSYYRHGVERRKMYDNHAYPYKVVKYML